MATYNCDNLTDYLHNAVFGLLADEENGEYPEAVRPQIDEISTRLLHLDSALHKAGVQISLMHDPETGEIASVGLVVGMIPAV